MDGLMAATEALMEEPMSEETCHEEMPEESCPYCSGKHKDRTDTERKDLMNRLKRIEGQVRGVEGMLESGAYCTDILMQVSAITSALNSFNKVLLGNHVKTCVAENIRAGNNEIIDELVDTLQKLMK
jgi:DNA-binding FrmR family transcriptional regulator